MADHDNDEWTAKRVEDHLAEAADVMQRLPPVRVQGYFSTWPAIAHDFADRVGCEPQQMRRPPPSPEAITRAEATLLWLRWLEVEDARLVWMRAERAPCLGLVRGVWRALHGDEPEVLPPYTPDWAEAMARETLAEAAGRHMVPVALAAIRPGDVLLFAMKDHAPAKHCAIMSGPDLMIHAIESHPVAEITLWSSERAGRRLRFAFTFPGLAD